MNKQMCMVVGAWVAGALSSGQAQYAGWQREGSMYVLTTAEGAGLPATAVVEGFPLLVRLNKEFFPFREAKAAGEDIRFSAGGKPLIYQIEEWDAAQGVASIWVKIPVIRGDARQEIKVHWGKADAASESNGSAVFGADNGFATVMHMDESLKDEVGSVTPVDAGTTAAVGMIGAGRHFTVGKGINGGDHITTYPFGDAAFTTEAWFRAENAGGMVVYWGRYATRLNGKTGDGNEVDLGIGSPPVLGWASDGPGGAGANPEAPIAMGTWYHVAATYDNGESRIYVNGKLEGSRTHKAAMSVVKDVCMNIGGMRGGNYHYAGDIDEVRVSRVARSDDWMKLQYENQKPGQTAVGPLVQKGSEFAVSATSISLAEGKSATVTAKAGGAQKIYWIIVREGRETVVAVDRFSYTVEAGRVTKDTNLTLRLKAVYPDGVKSKDIPVAIKEEIPEPVVTLKAPPAWNGRDPVEVVPVISNLAAMKAKGAGEVTTAWSVAGGAVIKEAAPGKLLLKRSQFTGKITVNATVNNGGTDTVASTVIAVTEPKSDPWVQRVPGKDEQPEDNQFYARDDKNEGTLFYNGHLDEPADSVFVKVYADDKPYKGESAKLAADKSYAFTVKLKPGLVKYKVEFGTVTGGAQKVLRTVNNLICGDAYIIDGQSNAEASGPNNGTPPESEYFSSEWIRSFGNQHQGTVQGGWGNAVRTQRWGSQQYGNWQIGTWGMMLAKNLLERHKIPVCIINGAYGGTPIFQHQRNPENHFDTSGGFYVNPYKIYGSLLTRVTAAKLTHGIRGVLWHQGENDQGSGAPTGDYNWKSWQQYFIDMSAAWKEDFPNIRHYYIYQIWPSGCNMGGTKAGDMLLEVQRTLPFRYSNMRIMSTLGVVSGSSGRGLCHFDLDGYAQLAEMMTPVVEQDNYGLAAGKVYTAPNLRRARFSAADKAEVTLEFDQPMQWKPECKAWLELDGTPAAVESGKTEGNSIVLRLSAPTEAKTIAYVSGRTWDGKPDKLLYGTNGIAALAFSAVPVEATGSPATGR